MWCGDSAEVHSVGEWPVAWMILLASVAPLACTASFAGTMTSWNFLNSSAWLQPCELCLLQFWDVKKDCNLIAAPYGHHRFRCSSCGLCFDVFMTGFAMLYTLTAIISGLYYQPPHLGGLECKTTAAVFGRNRSTALMTVSGKVQNEQCWQSDQWLSLVLLRLQLIFPAVMFLFLDMSHELSLWTIRFCMFLWEAWWQMSLCPKTNPSVGVIVWALPLSCCFAVSVAKHKSGWWISGSSWFSGCCFLFCCCHDLSPFHGPIESLSKIFLSAYVSIRTES